MTTSQSLTPLMRQYRDIKRQYPDAILLFRVGDFYEAFGEDAVKLSQILDIVLTKRNPKSSDEGYLAGFPYHALDSYLYKLSQAGIRIAICEQMEDAKLAKGIVKRAVTDLITPGTRIHDKTLSGSAHNFIAALIYLEKTLAIAFADVSTGEFWVADGDENYIDRLLQTNNPAEVLLSKNGVQRFKNRYKENFFIFPLEDWIADYKYTYDLLLNYFQTHSLKGLGLENSTGIVTAMGMIVHYIQEIQKPVAQHFARITKLDNLENMWLDQFTIWHLDILPSSEKQPNYSLWHILNHTSTPMGARLLRHWLLFPLKKINKIVERQDLVQELMQQIALRESLREILQQCGDLERYITRVALNKSNSRELQRLGQSLAIALKIGELWASLQSAYAQNLYAVFTEHLDIYTQIVQELEKTLREDAPAVLHKTPCIKAGVNPELDEYRRLIEEAEQDIANMQLREAQKYDIPSLKISYNNVFGHYIEVSNTHKHKVPSDWQRRQTLSNAERYITEELKEYEGRVKSAEYKIQELEALIFTELLQKVQALVAPIRMLAHSLASMDVLLNLAHIAERYQYVRPELHNGEDLELISARHPIIEQYISPYIPNDLILNPENRQIILLTGPNMSGKSALLRKVALITILAHIGAFVPCEYAKIPLTEKIFTRVGASDNMSAGESTFMVEMNETSMIVNNIGPRTLVLLDEIGRGTSTYDGVAIASAVLSFLHEHPDRPKVLFATHYHELSSLAKQYARIKNFHIAYEESDKGIVFLRKLVEGATQRSFGIQVAKMAGLPQSIINLAKQNLQALERGSSNMQDFPLFRTENHSPQTEENKRAQALCAQILALDINNISPLDALLFLTRLQKELQTQSKL